MATLKQIIDAINSLDATGDKDSVIECLTVASAALNDALKAMDGIGVQGRTAVDTLLGCMMALDMIIGKEEKHGE